jgi:hypothetical protein
MTINSENYLVEIAIGGINKDTDPMAEKEFSLELDLRPHILNRNLFWDRERETLIVQTEIVSLTKDLAAAEMAEELFEVANAVLLSVQGLKVKVLAVSHIEQ